MMQILHCASLATMLSVLAGCNLAPQSAVAHQAPATPATVAMAMSDTHLLAQGEYLVRIGGCNDCHTPGYDQAAGDIPKAQWLLGSPLGWHGPWGTTFAANLRLKAAEMDETAWLKYTGELHTRPPMPDFNLRAMKEHDRRAIYRFIRSLGPGGQPAPPYLPPGQTPSPPYVHFVMPPAPPAAAQTAG